MMNYINGNCTPRMLVVIEIDENPNGLPVLWLSIHSDNSKRLASMPLDKKAVGQLLVELAERIGEM